MSSSVVKATWTPPFHKIFVELCLREVLKMKEPGTRLTKEGWRNIVGSFYAKTGVRYDKRQFKNHYDSTRKLWKVWVKLIGDSSMKWDPETNQFGASDEDWINYIKVCMVIIYVHSRWQEIFTVPNSSNNTSSCRHVRSCPTPTLKLLQFFKCKLRVSGSVVSDVCVSAS